MSSHPSSAALARAQALLDQGQLGDAFRLLDEASLRDPLAAMTLAEWRLSGQLVRRDIAAARAYYGRASALGLAEAAEAFIALLANGAGGSGRDWPEALAQLEALARHSAAARRQRDLLGAMAIDPAGDPLALPDTEPVRSTPHIAVLRGFLSADECRYMVDCALPALQPSIVIHPQSGQPIHDPVRTAHSTGFPFVLEDPVIHAINRRIMAATGTRYEQGEPIQVLSYQPGQEYKLHSDCLPSGNNQRIQTFLVMLSDRFEGGETSFPRLGLNLRVSPGDAIHFINVDERGRPEPLAWHAGLPVRSGRKLILSKWIRQAPLDLSGPPGRPF